MSEKLATQIAAGVNMRALYPPNHPRVIQAVDAILAAIGDADEITFIIVDDDLVLGDDVIRKTTLSVRQFIEILKQKGIDRLTIANGIDEGEIRSLIGGLSGTEPLLPSQNVVLGRVRVAIQQEEVDRPRRELSVSQLEAAREAWSKFRVEKKLPMDQLEELVWSFVDSIGRTTRAILPLAKLREHDEYTFVHSVNVSLLVLAQARSFGIQGLMLHSFGMAALLHDIGKLTVPTTVLNKPGKLDGAEWDTMKGHPGNGAWYLSQIEGTPPLSILVAFEHHLRYDGRPNYPVLRTPRIPNLASRMTSIADAFDAMSTVRPYQKPLARAAGFEILRTRSETFYDPVLVGNFIRLVGDLE